MVLVSMMARRFMSMVPGCMVRFQLYRLQSGRAYLPPAQAAK